MHHIHACSNSTTAFSVSALWRLSLVNRLVAINGQHEALTQVVTAVLVHKAADKVRFIFR